MCHGRQDPCTTYIVSFYPSTGSSIVSGDGSGDSSGDGSGVGSVCAQLDTPFCMKHAMELCPA